MEATAAVPVATLEDADPYLLAAHIRYVDGLYEIFRLAACRHAAGLIPLPIDILHRP